MLNCYLLKSWSLTWLVLPRCPHDGIELFWAVQGALQSLGGRFVNGLEDLLPGEGGPGLEAVEQLSILTGVN